MSQRLTLKLGDGRLMTIALGYGPENFLHDIADAISRGQVEEIEVSSETALKEKRKYTCGVKLNGSR